MSKNITASLFAMEEATIEGLRCIEEGNFDEGDRILKKIVRKLEVVPKYKNDRHARRLLSLAYAYQSFLLYSNGELKQARERIEQSQEIFKSIKKGWNTPEEWYFWFIYAKTFDELGNIERDEGNAQAAYENFKKCYDILTMIRNDSPWPDIVDHFILLCLDSLSAYAYSTKAKDALKYTKRYFESYVEYYGTDYDPLTIADIYERLSLAYRREGKKKEERKYLKKAVKILLDLTRANKKDMLAKTLLGQAYAQLGEMETDEGNLEKAKTAYNQALNIFKEIQKVSEPDVVLIVSQVELEIYLSQIFHLMGDKKSRMELLEEATHAFGSLIPLNLQGVIGQVTRVENLYSQALEFYTRPLVEMGEYTKANSAFDDFYVFIAAWYRKGLITLESMAADLDWAVVLQLELLNQTLDRLKNEGNIRQINEVCDQFIESLEFIKGVVDQLSVDKIRGDVEHRRALLGQIQ